MYLSDLSEEYRAKVERAARVCNAMMSREPVTEEQWSEVRQTVNDLWRNSNMGYGEALWLVCAAAQEDYGKRLMARMRGEAVPHDWDAKALPEPFKESAVKMPPLLYRKLDGAVCEGPFKG